MSDSINEQISALLDGELPEEEAGLLLRRLDGDAKYREVLSRYSFVGALMRDDSADPAASRLGERVLAALSEETSFSGKTPRAMPWKGVGRGLAGAGIAAAAAFVAISALVGPGTDSGSAPLNTLAKVDAPGRVSYTVPVNRVSHQVIEPVRLTSYLVSHGEFSSAVSRRGIDSHIVRQMPETVGWKERTISANE